MQCVTISFSPKSASEILKMLFENGHIDTISFRCVIFVIHFQIKVAFRAKEIVAFLRAFLTWHSIK